MNAEAYPGEEVPEHLKMFVVEEKKKDDNVPGAPHATNKSLPKPLVPGEPHQVLKKAAFRERPKVGISRSKRPVIKTSES